MTYTVYTKQFDRVILVGDLKTKAKPSLYDLTSYMDHIGHARAAQLFTKMDLTGLSHSASTTTVTILVDNSGSLRGKPIVTALNFTKTLMRVLSKHCIKTEILGFTTRKWKGGSSYKKWLRCGKPPKPGRLNDILHIIYKQFDEHVSATVTRNLHKMLCEGLLKEDIPGESLQWAYDRLKIRPEPRKILIMISDGYAADSATDSVNGDLIKEHLSQVVSEIEADPGVELIHIHLTDNSKKPTPFSNNILLNDESWSDDYVANEIINLFQQRANHDY